MAEKPHTGGAIVTITLISLIAKIPCGSRISEIKTSPVLAGSVNPSLPKNSPSPSRTTMLNCPSTSWE